MEDGILIVRKFDEMRRTFSEQFKNRENKVPKDLMKEYETSEGGKVIEVGPIVYKYSMTIGPGAKPKIRECGNINSPFVGRDSSIRTTINFFRNRTISDISTTDL